MHDAKPTLARPQVLAGLRFWLITALMAAMVFTIRYAAVRGIEPHGDATYFAACLRDVAAATHVLPNWAADQSFSNALESDDKSLLYAVGRPIYSGPQWAFMQLSFLAESTLLVLMGYSYAHVVALSVLATALALIPLTALFMRCAHTTGVAGLAAAALYASSTYATLYSPWGVHNWGVFGLIVMAAGCAPVLASLQGSDLTSYRGLLVLGGLTLLAAYSHFTNPILAPLAVLLNLAALPRTAARRKIQLIAVYGLIVSAGLIPVGALSIVLHKTWITFGIFSGLGGSLGSYVERIPFRAVQWLRFGVQLFSFPGLLGGIAGLVWMAWSTKFQFPAWIIAAHFSSFCLIPGFIWNGSHTYLRTYNYSIPFLALGLGWLMLRVMRRGREGRSFRGLRIAVFAALVWHLVVQIPTQGYVAWAQQHSSDFTTDYLLRQGQLRPAVQDMERVATGEPILFWNNDEEWLYLALADDISKVRRSSLGAALDRKKRGERQRLEVPERGYLIALENERNVFSKDNLGSALLAISGREYNGELIRAYPPPFPETGRLLLYRVDAR